MRFFYIARGSLNETLSAFVAANAVGYVDDTQLKWVRDVELEAEKSLNGYIAFIRKQKQGESEYGSRQINENPVEYRPGISIEED